MSFAISSGDIIDVFAGGHLPESTTNWLNQQNEGLLGTVTTYARDFFQQAQSLYQMVSASTANMLMRNLKAKEEDAWSFEITRLSTLQGIQTANIINQRYIMANPEVRQRYLNQEVEGYYGTYVNHHGDAIGERHYDYRQVMEGIITHDESSFQYKQWMEETQENEKPLTLFQKVDVLRTWNALEKYLGEGDEDPTSVTGAML